MELSALKQQLSTALPLLIANRNLAYQEYIEGSLAHGAFNYVQSRLDTASAVLESEDIPADRAYKACAMVVIDLRSAVRDKDDGKATIDAWLECYADAGYTGIHKFFNIPVIPEVGTVQL